MSTIQVTVRVTVESLLAAIERLPPNELREFKEKFNALQKSNGRAEANETALIEATGESLPSAEMRRIKRLIAGSEQGTLTDQELTEYKSLSEKAERISVRRVEALAKLASLREK